MRTHCCPHSNCAESSGEGLSRRGFLGSIGGATAAAALRPEFSWAQVAAAGFESEAAPPRRTLVVQPLFIYEIPRPRPQTSWRSWGGIQTQADADAETARIRTELAALEKRADFPVRFLPLLAGRRRQDLPATADLPAADLLLVYAAGGSMQAFHDLFQSGKDVLFFVRYRSGPVYLWYEIISPRYLRQHTDKLSVRGITDEDVVVDSQEEILWRLRALCGVRNTLGTKILAVGGAGAWAQPPDVVPARVRELFHFDIQTVPYPELAELLKAARQDQEAVALAGRRAEAYLKLQQTTLETKREFVDRAFLLDHVFRGLMKKADCRAITINSCMGTIMPIAETSACLALSTLNDAGYMAFCESDFVVIPSGVLLANISGRPMFLNDPTYPHDGTITLAHCTSPRRLDGKTYERARILTHFESDYGAAPKVEMRNGQKVTNIIPDFAFKRWVGLSGEIIDSPFLPICRSQIDIRFRCDSLKVAEQMPGFHWMTIYGDYLKETGYALRRIPIEWENLG
jgi:hypothetical protein